jgi:hypothetical protein
MLQKRYTTNQPTNQQSLWSQCQKIPTLPVPQRSKYLVAVPEDSNVANTAAKQVPGSSARRFQRCQYRNEASPWYQCQKITTLPMPQRSKSLVSVPEDSNVANTATKQVPGRSARRFQRCQCRNKASSW